MTDPLFYIEALDNLGVPLEEAGNPWYTHDKKVAQFYVYTMNLTQGQNTYQVKEFAPIAYLDVPYKSQWGPTANVRRGDCGPACVAMIVPFLTEHNPSVNVMAEVCDQPPSGPGSLYTGHKQLREGSDGEGGAKFYDVTLATRSKYRPPILDMDLLKECLDAGLPSIALIHYGVLRNETNKLPVALGYVRNQDQNYERGHWVVVIGMDKKDVFIHDSDFWGTREQDGNARAVPRFAFFEALQAVAPGCSVGFQGLIVLSPESQLEGGA